MLGLFDCVEDFVRARCDQYLSDPDTTFQSLCDEWNGFGVGKRVGRKKMASLFADAGVSSADKKVYKGSRKGSSVRLVDSSDPRAVLLRGEWCVSRNGVIPSGLTVGSNKKFWWVCELGHQWFAGVRNRWGGSGCHYCSGRVVLEGFNDFASRCPGLVGEWCSSNSLSPCEVSYCSGRIVRWVCDSGHEWDARVSARVNGSGCPYCAKVYPSGEYSLASEFPVLVGVWDSEKNTLSPSEVLPKSNMLAWWKCGMGHSYEMRVADKVRDALGDNCPVCNHKVLLSGFNDFGTLYPDLLKFWNDADADPSDFPPSSLTVVSWKCRYGHEFDMSVKAFVAGGGGCPVCSGRRVVSGVNDLTVVSPELLRFWDYEANDRVPSSLTCMSGYRASWVCDSGHKWQATVRDRYYYNTECPKCSLSGFSKLEKDFAQFVESLNVGIVVENDGSVLGGRELDVFVPSKMIAFEFNGLYWHSEGAGKDKSYHYNKWFDCRERGVQLITVWEDDWLLKRGVVERLVKSKLGVLDVGRVFARQTTPVVLGFGEAKKFLDDYHVQGSTVCRVFGLRDCSGILVAVLGVVSRGDGVVEVVRYASSRLVVGGFTKLLKFMISELGVLTVVSFSDNEVSDGGLYEKNGFTVDAVIPPDYKYVVGGRREHKFNYRKSRFESDSSLLWVDGLTESELAVLNGFDRVWDCGKVKWSKNV